MGKEFKKDDIVTYLGDIAGAGEVATCYKAGETLIITQNSDGDYVDTKRVDTNGHITSQTVETSQCKLISKPKPNPPKPNPPKPSNLKRSDILTMCRLMYQTGLKHGKHKLSAGGVHYTAEQISESVDQLIEAATSNNLISNKK